MIEYDGTEIAENFVNFAGKVQKFLVPYIMTCVSERKRQTNDNSYIDSKYDLMIDIGCGDGKSTTPFADKFRSVVGYDISKEQIKMAKNSKIPDNVKFEVSRGESIPALDASVDLITSAYAVQDMDLEKFFNECKRVMKRSGVIAIYGSTVKDLFIRDPPKNAKNKTSSALNVLQSTYSDLMTQHFKTIGHPEWHIFDKYDTVFQGEYGFKKFRRDDLELSETITFSNYISSLDYVPAWKKFNELSNGKMSKHHQLEENLRDFWNIQTVDGKDIMLEYVRSIYLLIFHF